MVFFETRLLSVVEECTQHAVHRGLVVTTPDALWCIYISEAYVVV